MTYASKLDEDEKITSQSIKNGTSTVHTAAYTYDDAGIRTSKTVNGVTTHYNTDSGVILSQYAGTNVMNFQYDSNGAPAGFTYNGEQYYYLTNQMGDVVAISDTEGTAIVTYRYDEWGNLFSINIAEAGNEEQLNIAYANPIRYRGYYFDAETGYYYLQSRYYDPQICRFVNADVIGFVGFTGHSSSYNLFVYCENNPVIYKDATGESITVTCILIGAGVGLIVGSWVGNRIANKKRLTPNDGWKYWKYVVGYGVLGTVTGGLVGWGAGTLIAKYGVTTAATSITKGGGARFSSFNALKRSMGSAGKGKHWHHIVEQSQISKSGFSKYWIHNSNNVIKIDASVHSKITAYYNKVHNFTKGKTFRNWLKGKSFKEQYNWGVKVLKMYGVKMR